MYVGRSNWAYYNEFEDYPAEWIENLIRLGVIAPGVVDRRSIEDVRPDDLRGFRQCHFFAGIGVWSYALRRAGVSDDTALWTGSCPCQPWSAAGKGTGVDDERHLWPAFFHLIGDCRPPRIYGEQVASKDGLGWLDLVQADLEGADYSIWAVDTCSAGSGAPHIRQRLRFCADDLRSTAKPLGDTAGARSFPGALGGIHRGEEGPRSRYGEPERSGGAFELADSDISGLEGRNEFGSGRAAECSSGAGGVVERMAYDSGEHLRRGRGEGVRAPGEVEGETWERQWSRDDGRPGGSFEHMAYADGGYAGAEREQRSREQRQQPEDSFGRDRTAPNRPGPTNGFWGDADWIFCRDGKWRPTQPGLLPLVDGSAFHLGSGSAFEGKSRQGMLKGYGNAIDAEATIDFIEATLEPDTLELDSVVVGSLDELLG